LHRAERAIAERVASIAATTLPWPPIVAEKALPWVEKLTGAALAEHFRAGYVIAGADDLGPSRAENRA